MAKPPMGGNRSREPLASGPETLKFPPELPPDSPREPILTLPGALTAYVLLLAVIHLRVLLPPELENWTVDAFGFIPKRYDSTLLAINFPGGAGAKVWTFVTYSLLHANLSHIGFNVLWLLPFGSALARRFGAIRFFLFMAVTAVADAAAKVPALSLGRALRNGRVLGFLAVWFGVNIIFGIGSIAIGADGASVAWQAHIGGFFAGLVLFSLFDPVPRAAPDAAAASSSDASERG